MNGISSSGKEQIAGMVETMFDNIALEFVGDIPRLKNKKRMVISSKGNFGLPHLFVQAMQNKQPNELEADVMKGFLNSAYGYIDSLKARTRTAVTERIDSLVREAKASGRRPDESEIKIILDEEMAKARSQMQTIAEAESTKMRNMGHMMEISRMAAQVDDSDPNVFFVVVKDGSTCKECIRLHLMPDASTPRIWKLSELKQGYHKRSENVPSVFGLHPHCFTGSQLIATDKGLISFKDLFDSQEAPNVLVDYRINNRLDTGNQFGKPIHGKVWLNPHSKKDARFLPATPVYETGIQNVIRFTLDSGQQIEVSEGHEMWSEVGNSQWQKISASKIKVGDKVPLSAKAEMFGQEDFELEAELMGNLLGDGTINKSTKWSTWNFFGNDIPYGQELNRRVIAAWPQSNQLLELNIKPPNEKYNVSKASFSSSFLGNKLVKEFDLSKSPRQVPARLFKANKRTVSAFLRGIFAADGHSELNTVILSQNDIEFLRQVQILLSMYGIVSRIYDHGVASEKMITYANGETFATQRKACFRLYIGGHKQAQKFINEIGFGVPFKQDTAISNLKSHQSPRSAWVTAKISKIEHLGKQQTYCLTEPMTNTVTVNGIVTGQCRCTLTYLSQGFGFKDGRLAYVDEGHDEHRRQNKKK